jgi:hypothetical protein
LACERLTNAPEEGKKRINDKRRKRKEKDAAHHDKDPASPHVPEDANERFNERRDNSRQTEQ